MKKIAALAALSASAFALSTGASFADYTLNILHFNDWHSRLESNNKYESTCSAEEETKGECIGGAARLTTAINQEREKLKGQNVLLLNAGDNFQGSLFYTTFKGAAEEEFLNKWMLDAVTLGNHEFDDGESALVPYLEKAKFPVVSANVIPDDESGAKGKLEPSIVLDIGGQKIGIVGAVTMDTPEIASPGPHIKIDDDVRTITAQVEKLKGEGVNKIIAVTHIGYEREKSVIAKISGIDVVVGGHSHTLLSNTDPKAAGPYPTMVDNPDGYKVPVVQAASYSKYLGEFKVVFDDAGVVKEASGDPIFLDKSIKPDEAVLARVKEMGAPIEALKNKQVGEFAVPVDGSRDNCRARECAMGDLVADAILSRVKGQGVEIVIQNGGGLRASIDAGPVTMGEVLTVLPFQNTLATFQIDGKDLLAAMEVGLSQIKDGAGRFPQVAGMRYSFDNSVGPDQKRIKSADVMESGAWMPLDPAKTYLVATNNYVRQGGDGYKLFASNGTNAYDYGPGLEQVVADYIGTKSPLDVKLDQRIVEMAQAQPISPAAPRPAVPAAPAAPAVPVRPAAPGPAGSKPRAPAAAAEDAATPAQTAPGGDVKMPEMPAGSGDIANQPPSLDTGTPSTPTPAPAEATPATTEPAPAETPAPVQTTPSNPAPVETTPPADAKPATEPTTPAETTPAPATDQPAKPPADAAPAPETTQPAPAETPATAPSPADSAPSPVPTPTPAPAPAVPAPAETMPTEPSVPAKTTPAAENTHVIVRGDTLSKLAKEAYGDGKKWPLIAAANPNVNPNVLPVGETITIPPAN